MSMFQLLLFIVSGVIFYLFFKQLFSGNHPKRGVDFEAKVADEQIGGISRLEKTFSSATVKPTRIEQLIAFGDESLDKKDYDEAKKAFGSVLILDENHTESIQKLAYISMEIKAYDDAEEYYLKLIDLDHNDDMAHALLANVYHALAKEDESKKHHKMSISLDSEYAPHYFNYANTLFDLDELEASLENYKRAYALDDTIEDAKVMIDKLSSKSEQ